MTVVKATINNGYSVKYRFYNSVAPFVAGILAERLDVPKSYSTVRDLTRSVTVTMLFTQEEHDPNFDPDRFQRVFEGVRAKMPRKPYFDKATPEFNARVKAWRSEAFRELSDACNGVFL